MIECIDTLGARLVEGDLVVAQIKSNVSIAKILPEATYTAGDMYGRQPNDLPYMKIATIGLSRRWMTKKGSTFRHPYYQYYPTTKEYQKYGQYVYKFQIREALLYKHVFMAKLPDYLDFMEFAKKHYSAMHSMGAEHSTLQTQHGLVELLIASVADLRKF